MGTIKEHPFDQAYVLQYIICEMYNLEIIDIKQLEDLFNYSNTSIYRLIRKINDNQERMGRKHKIIKVRDYIYKGIIEEE